MSGTKIGTVTHYYDRIMVAVIQLTGEIKLGDEIHILGRSVDFKQKVTSLQVEHQSIQRAGPGQEAALQVIRPVRPPASVFLLDAEEAV